MSLSQKHSGKVLVPWFNTAEWASVYDLIYNDSRKNWTRALEVLKIWKLRTPLLSAGVEGTLIVLEALLVDFLKLSHFETTHIFSTSLVRFLNLCAANSDKQGTFYKVAMKNELPKWLISLRHDIAHSHKVPSKSMLKLGLNFCLEWIEQKYWKIQLNEMTDLIANESGDKNLDDLLYIFIQLTDKSDNSENIQYDKMFLDHLNRLPKTLHKKQLNNKKLLESVTSLLKDCIKDNPQGAAEKISSVFIDNSLLLSTDCNVNDDGKKRLQHKLVSRWKNLINLLHETEILLDFVVRLFIFICNPYNNNDQQEIASLWIKEIFQGLLNKDRGIHSVLVFDRNLSMKNKEFAAKVIENVTPYTLNFIKIVLEYNEAPPDFIEDTVTMMCALTPQNNSIRVNGILTIEDINFNLPGTTERESVPNNKCNPTLRWQVIEDTGPYQNLPLGILPHQARNTNPVLGL